MTSVLQRDAVFRIEWIRFRRTSCIGHSRGRPIRAIEKHLPNATVANKVSVPALLAASRQLKACPAFIENELLFNPHRPSTTANTIPSPSATSRTFHGAHTTIPKTQTAAPQPTQTLRVQRRVSILPTRSMPTDRRAPCLPRRWKKRITTRTQTERDQRCRCPRIEPRARPATVDSTRRIIE